MSMRVTMIQARMGESGSVLAAGSTYTVTDPFGALLVGKGWATDTDGVLSPVPSSLTPAQLSGMQKMYAGTMTRAELITLAEADGLLPGAVYRTVEGVIATAKTARFLESANWFDSSQRWATGGSLTYKNLPYVMLPPIDVNGGFNAITAGQMTGSTRTKRIYLTLGGTTSDAPNSSGTNVTPFERNFNSATLQYAWETLTRVRCAGSSSRLVVRNVGASAPGIDSSGSGISGTGKRILNMDLNTSKLLRTAALVSKVGTPAAISGLQISAGYAYGTVAAATFGETVSLVRTAQISGATEGAFNVDPVDVQLLSTGYPTPVVAADGTDPATITAFRYAVSSGSGSATGSPVLTLYDDLVLDQFTVQVVQGAI